MDQEQIIDVSNIDLSEIESNIVLKLSELCKSIFDKQIDEVPSEDLSALLNIDINSSIETMNVYCQSTRQVEQYQPNGYSLSETISFRNSYAWIHNHINTIPNSNQKVVRYAKLKSILYKLMSQKYHSTESFLRSLIREAEQKDGVKPLGRFTE